MANGGISPHGVAMYFDNAGAPLAGGKLYTYASGTAVALATYSDAALTTPNANPIILDSAGRATVWLTSAAYRFILKDSAGSTLWTMDNISNAGEVTTTNLAASTAGNGDELVAYKAAGTGAVARTVHARLSDERYSVKDFGAIGNGTSDDTTKIQAAIDACVLTGGVVYFPPGNYLVSNALTIDSPGVTLEGAGGFYGSVPGQRGTRITMAAATTNKDVILVTSATRAVEEVVIRDLHIAGNRASGATGHGIHLYGAVNSLSRVTIERVYVTNCKQHGIYLDSSAGRGYVWMCTVRDFVGSYCGGSGLKVEAVVQCRFSNIYVSHNYGHNFFVDAASAAFYSAQLLVDRLASEYADEGDAGTVYGLALIGTLFSDFRGLVLEQQSNHIYLKSIQGVRIWIDALGQVERAALNGTPTPGGGVHDIGIMFDANFASTYIAGVEIEAPGFINSSANNAIEFTGTVVMAGAGLILGYRGDSSGTYVVPFRPEDLENFATYEPFVHFKAPAGALRTAEVEVAALSGATGTATGLIPAGSLVLGVTARVTTAITGTATSFLIGHGGDTDAWGATIAKALNTVTTGADFVATAPLHFAAATDVVLTATGGTFTTGAVRLKVTYVTFQAPLALY